jgi:hypothetical protein
VRVWRSGKEGTKRWVWGPGKEGTKGWDDGDGALERVHGGSM